MRFVMPSPLSFKNAIQRYRSFPLAKRIEEAILYLLLFSLPLGTRILLFQGQDAYQSGFLYASDILLLLLLGLFVYRGGVKNAASKGKPFVLPALFFFFWLILAALASQNSLLGLYRSLKIVECMGLFFYIATQMGSGTRYKTGLAFVLAGGVLQAALALFQALFQGDLGLWILGENMLSVFLAGVAKIDILGAKFLRVYGTLPHPNILALLLVISLALSLWLASKKRQAVLPLLPLPFISAALLLTFSRTVIVFGLLAIALWLLWNYQKRALRGLIVLACSLVVFVSILFPLLANRFDITSKDEGIALRGVYVRHALQITKNAPLLGVGPGMFTAAQQDQYVDYELPRWANQPVHNMYLLLAAEAGLPSLVFFLWLIFVIVGQAQRKQHVWFYLSILVLILALFDHFFLSFQQGALLFWLTLGMAGIKARDAAYEN